VEFKKHPLKSFRSTNKPGISELLGGLAGGMTFKNPKGRILSIFVNLFSPLAPCSDRGFELAF